MLVAIAPGVRALVDGGTQQMHAGRYHKMDRPRGQAARRPVLG
jgi:hypothetical protein